MPFGIRLFSSSDLEGISVAAETRESWSSERSWLEFPSLRKCLAQCRLQRAGAIAAPAVA